MKSKKLIKNIKIGDNVIIISGREKGKSGYVKDIDRRNRLLVVEGLFLCKRHIKKNVNSQKETGIIASEAWIPFSKIKK